MCQRSGKYFFLSRPRRFGKSLFIDTLKQAFLGNKAVFNGLYIYRIIGIGGKVIPFCNSVLLMVLIIKGKIP